MSSPLWGSDKERGKALYGTCLPCHGDRGEGFKSKGTPKIAGQHDWFIVEELEESKEKDREWRKPSQGRAPHEGLAALKNLSQKDIRDLAAYITGLKPL